jgi:hypothetical protein
LLTNAETTSPTVQLADFLPRDASAALRRQAQSISLGRAPLAGSLRVLSGAQVERSLQEHPLLMEQVIIPERIVVLRRAFPISAQDVLKAVDSYFRSRNAPGVPDPLWLDWSGAESTAEHPPLEILSGNWNHLSERLELQMRCSDRKACGSFLVALKSTRPIWPTWETIWRSNAPEPYQGTTQMRARREPALAQVGRQAKLILEAPAMQLSLPVICLESGRVGEVIRAREVGGTRIFRAVVESNGRLRADLTAYSGRQEVQR